MWVGAGRTLLSPGPGNSNAEPEGAGRRSHKVPQAPATDAGAKRQPLVGVWGVCMGVCGGERGDDAVPGYDWPALPEDRGGQARVKDG